MANTSTSNASPNLPTLLDPPAEIEVHDHTHWHRARRHSAGLSLPLRISVDGCEDELAQPIALEDHTLDLDHDHCDGEEGTLWARSVVIEGYGIVGGRVLGVGGVGGGFVQWTVGVGLVDGGSIKILKRYSDFEILRQRLVRTFPDSDAAMPLLPHKNVVSRFKPEFLEKRRCGLQYFLSCVLLNPEFAGCPVLKEFLFR